ncbi:response regulator, partial [Paenibacillus sp. E194]|uniref:response regulator n=1 Tax=Paenibacillus sp. E194 TaxID=1458845 RepID=UPI0005C88692
MSEQVNRILIVDDEERIRRLLKMYLEKEGFEIEEAEDGEAALRMAVSEEYDLILLDLMLPGIDGVEVCTRLKQVKATPV